MATHFWKGDGKWPGNAVLFQPVTNWIEDEADEQRKAQRYEEGLTQKSRKQITSGVANHCSRNSFLVSIPVAS